MTLKKGLIPLFFIGFCQVLVAQKQVSHTEFGNIKLDFMLDEEGTAHYGVSFKQKTTILPSLLGFSFGDNSFDNHFQLLGIDSTAADHSWKPVWGEVNLIRDHYKQVIFHLKEKKAGGVLLNIVFRIFEEGVGFRYEFPVQPGLKYFIISNELTQFNLTGDHKVFWIPGDYDTNEYAYTTSPVSKIDNRSVVKNATEIVLRNAPDPFAVQTPLMINTADGLYMNIHEAAQVNYPAMQLHADTGNYRLTARLVPDAAGNKAYLRTPAVTPWRTIIVSNKAADILASKMILNLNEPSRIENTSWIKPMKFIGIWWELQTGKSSWSYGDNIDSVDSKNILKPHGRHGATTANAKRYIDFASKHGIDGVLVEGWNSGWEEWFNLWKEDPFDFVTPYPDFNIKEITTYAASKNVQLVMHNETSGAVTNYERQMDTAFRFMNKYGYTAVKTGYVGKIIPRGEYHDGQWMSGHYLRSVKKAADHQIMIDIHEPVRPTGLHRTWPNFLACEAGRGNEFNAFSLGNPPEHETILPFTRLIGGPMDYTPGIFKIKNYAANPEWQIHTTLAKQLALYVVFYSPLQMAADIPENYEAHPDAFRFIKDVAVNWDETKIIDAEPGDYITIARKAAGTANWFIGAVTDENGRSTTLPLGFLATGKKYTARIYGDADNADWKKNPEAYKIETFIVDQKTNLQLKLAPGGGAAISIIPATTGDLKTWKKYE